MYAILNTKHTLSIFILSFKLHIGALNLYIYTQEVLLHMALTHNEPWIPQLLVNVRFLTNLELQLLVQFMIIFRLDYCNALLTGLRACAVKPLQMF